MGWKDWLKKPEAPIDPLQDLVLAKLRVGYLVDYDLKTWQVTERFRYDFGDGYGAEEWELSAGDERLYLERSEDDGVEWGLSRTIPFGKVDGDIRKHIREHDDPPDRVTCEGETYFLDESGPAHMERDAGERIGFVYWSYVHEDGQRFLTLEQWGENEFEASLGHGVEEYQFSNILPGGE